MMSNSLKLICLNLEGHKHLELQMPFFRAQSPDVLCLQEVFESDFIFLKNELALNGAFAPMCTKRLVEGDGIGKATPWGIAMLSKFPLDDIEKYYYVGDPAVTHEFIRNVTTQAEINKVLMYGRILVPTGDAFVIGTTHFTWTPNGQADDLQRSDLRALMSKLATIPEIAFCGDFNAPRGREIFTEIARKYKDNIPAHYTTSTDGALHRAGQLELMVDGLFSTPEYQVTNVRLENGVSDHCAIVADVVRDKK